ncbi:TIGR01457 family HAD-type hydrolase [Psychrobacillus lasiicapitis]|uniref:TIGR01457 family HAD-type hydrolase n=1 Tax=Psychrobacillus lasiicapitis TaxID=1636719 RepID=A0A544T051_9BACI|nr:TIGR01457 family HAD-type hydrolase [Psychrobacillus lasiicapitis]TQR10805.1 TIGR01457 family HAD-type hydrolase [Psychrobacillus lasiicapitis]GGA42325.1 haloacid dehalogenase [Psychrobacillus lasiicapitis]
MLNYKAYCLDLDGTVYRGKTPIKEAVDFVHYLQSNGIEPFFVTNNSSMTQKQLQEKIAKMDIHVEVDHIISSSIAAANYIEEHFPKKSVFMIGEIGLQDALAAKQVVRTEAIADVVVMGIDRAINYEKLSTACLSIRAGAAFISTNSDHAFPDERGLVPGNGAFTKLVEYSTGVEPIYMGKPEAFMLEFIQEKYGYKKEEMIMIGDNYSTDILTGIHMGIHTAHVNSGVNRTEEVQMKLSQPTYCLESLHDWIK